VTNQIHHLNLQTFLFFHIIATSLYTLLPAFLENPPSVKFCSSHPKTLKHCFLNCLPCLKTLSTQLMLHKSENMVVGECQIRTIGGVWKNISTYKLETPSSDFGILYFPSWQTNLHFCLLNSGLLVVSWCELNSGLCRTPCRELA
jgi:hypothetical protein